ncbi:MAG: hypothetical protein BWX78_00594 [Firmicutes bacterium ADurb.Bin099]|nr:MAG: hypothetical protein BWX78_00594 [Firmicutes bacterium ADurb.Bin099]
MDTNWLMENGNDIIKYHITKNTKFLDHVQQNTEFEYWFNLFMSYFNEKHIGNVHGSHDYRMENILGKLWVLGLNAEVKWFDEKMKFIFDFLDQHTKRENEQTNTFRRIYQNHDFETVLCCFLPHLGYGDSDVVKRIVNKRIKYIYDFVKEKRFDIYIDAQDLKGVKKEWKPYIINPDLYSDGNVKLPSVHDIFLFAGVYRKLSVEMKQQADAIVDWVLDERCQKLKNGYGYFYVEDGEYNTKTIIRSLRLQTDDMFLIGSSDLQNLLLNMYIMSYFKSGIESDWFIKCSRFLNQYEDSNGIYEYPPYMLIEKKDNYFTNGGHMNPGLEKSKMYRKILSQFWNELIFASKL